ncbi:SDR family NAD(P)-dependent oxidoreductase [Chitinophaga pendula]|nr:SDR family NAD(P)-dependent oxidoreductase [Chitinophaga pendula]
MLGIDAELITTDADWESDLGLDSIRLATIWRQLCENFPQYQLRHDAIYNNRTIAQLVAYLEEIPATTENGKEAPDAGITVASGITTDAEKWLINTLSVMTGVPATIITADTLLESELGMDSLRLVELQLQFERQFPAIKKGKERIFHFSTVKELVEQLPAIPIPAIPEKMMKIDDGIPKLSQHSSNGIVKEEPVIRSLLHAGIQQINVAGGLPAEEILLVGDKSRTQMWGQYLRQVTRVKMLVTGRKKWKYNSKEYTMDNEGSALSLLSDLEPGRSPLIIFLANTSAGKKTKMHSSGITLLKFAQLLDKGSLPEQSELNISIVIEGNERLSQIAARGVAKTLSKEWIHSSVRTVDMQSAITHWSPAELLQLLQYAPVSHDLVLHNAGLYKTLNKAVTTDEAVSRQELLSRTIGPGQVILLLGGACGITAALTRALSVTYPCHFVCVGRTALPSEDPLPGEDAAALTIQELLQRMGTSETDISHLQKRLKLLRRQQAIFRTRQAVIANGAKFHYLQADTSSQADMKKILTYCKRLGPLAGVVHGTGFFQDARIPHKTTADFKTVFNAKVSTARHLYKQLQTFPDLQFVCFMSSIAAVYGNAGQADYVAANDWLNELASQWNKEVTYPVKSLLWGIWSETGFARDKQGGLRMLTEHGVQGISNQAGAAAFLRELYSGTKEAANILLTTPSCQEFLAAAPAAALCSN